MKRNHCRPILIIAFTLVLSLQACTGLPGIFGTPTATSTPVPTDTPQPTDTKPPNPTRTPAPTVTPNLTATQLMGDLDTLMELFREKGYVTATNGRIMHLESFDESWARINWFRWFDVAGHLPFSDFVFMGHFKWTTASATPNTSGCGVAFAIQPENKGYYAVFLDKSKIAFYWVQNSLGKRVGKTRGTGRVNIKGDPAEADFVLAVKDTSAYVSVNGEVTEYSLSLSQSTEGNLALGLLSGTNKGYGTHCQIPDPILWIASD